MFDTGNTGFMLVATSLVMLMTPGLAFFYGGLVGRKNVLSIMIQSFVSMGWTTLLWWMFGYSLVFSGGQGLWLNFAQLFYFPFLVFILLAYPEYFIMTYAIITGAHFFPYAWYYKSAPYAIMAGIISVGAMVLGLFLSPE